MKADEFLDILKKEITDSLDDSDDQTVAEVCPDSAESGDGVEVHEEPLKISPDDLYIFWWFVEQQSKEIHIIYIRLFYEGVLMKKRKQKENQIDNWN